MSTTIMYYANAGTSMKQEAIEKVTSELNTLFSNDTNINWDED
ncbi:hypothetical protein [Tepidanaerobacter syntrophicus]|nr:hypothetical protein [Tepidanaerobacter syntrophicus]